MIIDPYEWHEVPIVSVASIATDTVAVKVDKPAGYLFFPGQYCLLRAGTNTAKKSIRQYSFSSPPHADQLEFVILKQPGGEVSGWMNDQAKPGSTIAITRPYGHFQKNSHALHHVMIAGGVGVAPFLSMLRDDASHTTLIYSESQPDSVIVKNELTALLGTDYNQNISSATGRIDEALLATLVASKNCYYICGSKRFTDTMQMILTNELGVSRETIRRETFTLE